MPEWAWWVIGGLGTIAGLWFLFTVAIMAVIGREFIKGWDDFWS